ncbi:MAG: mRNA 3'-end-processing protein rna14 [Piccolia ochrophora]|nr:MAG: mRNA 3'-end-processing protein rna14 [Piccolia ochrophora]
MDAELAFLDSMRAMSEVTGNYETEGVAEPDQANSQSLHEASDHSKDINAPSSTAHADDSLNAVPAVSPSLPSSAETLDPNSNSAQVSQTDAGDQTPEYDPTDALASPRPYTPNVVEGKTKPAEPRTVGGFIVDDDDEDDDDISGSVDAAGRLAASDDGARGTSRTPRLSSIQSPLNTLASAQDVSLANAAPNRASSVAQNGSHDASVNPASLSSPDARLRAQGAVLDAAQGNQFSQAADTTVPSSSTGTTSKTVPKARLPHDRVGILEDRVKEDPRGDINAWLGLIEEHRKRNKVDDARGVYERFLKLFPMAGEQWVAYANMELGNNDFFRLEQLFNKSLLTIPYLQLWSLYLDYVRRRNNLTTDPAGTARTIVSQAYDFVLQNVGLDKDSGRIWQDYIQFTRSGPGMIGGSNWQDQQKMDQLRKAYQRAICVPTSAVNSLWKEYDAFEMGLNKITGRKFLQEKSPAYMTARSSFTELENITQGLNRTTLPKLPPAPGFDGDDEFTKQVQLWKRWIDWERHDPLVLKDEDTAAYKARVVFVFQQALMALRFWPAMWFEASEYAFENGLEKEGTEFLVQGMAANPESCLLAFKRADRLENTLSAEEGEDGLKRRGATVRQPYDKVLDALYELIAQAKSREAQEISRIEEQSATGLLFPGTSKGEEDDDEEREAQKAAKDAVKQSQIKIVQDGTAVQVRILSRAISFAWIALMRAMRRVQGKGKVGDVVGGSRQIFTDARKRGRLTSDVYVASALIEYHCYKDPAATKIFERGMKLFPEDENFALEYLKHLIAINDVTNARAVFETTVSKLTQRSETRSKAKPICAFFHQFEAHYGELSQIAKLEKRMSDLFPEDPQLSRFSHRFATQGFDPTAVRPIISPKTQTRPKALPSIENPPSAQSTPPPRFVQPSHSPKRSLPTEDHDAGASRPRKLARGESPLKGAAGRRLDQQKRTQQLSHGQVTQNQWATQAPPPPPLPRDVLFLLSIIPGAHTYHAARFKPEAMVRLLRDTNIPAQQGSAPRMPPAGAMHGQPNGRVEPPFLSL